MVAQAFIMGGHTRVGLEDNFYIEKNVEATSNAQLVQKAVSIIRLLGGERTHVLDEAARCDDVLLLRDGAILDSGTPAALRERTGAADLDEAFMRLVERAEGQAP